MTILQQMIFKKSVFVPVNVVVAQQQQRRCCAAITTTGTRLLLNNNTNRIVATGTNTLITTNKYSPGTSTNISTTGSNNSRCSYSIGSSCTNDNNSTLKAAAVVVSSSSNHRLKVFRNHHKFLQLQLQLQHNKLGVTRNSTVRSLSTSSSNSSPTSTSSSLTTAEITSEITSITSPVAQQKPQAEQLLLRERKPILTTIKSAIVTTMTVAVVATVVTYTCFHCLKWKLKMEKKFAQDWNNTKNKNNSNNNNNNNNNNNTSENNDDDTTTNDSSTTGRTGTEMDFTSIDFTPPLGIGTSSVWGMISNEKNTTTRSSNKNNVLVLPFYRMKIIEQYYKDQDIYSSIDIERIKKILQRIQSFFKKDKKDNTNDIEDNNEIITIELNELIHLIHTAASDPTIVGIYGIFGTDGSSTNSLSSLGWGQLEELRTALRIFNECHRIHKEPNINYNNSDNEQQEQQHETTGTTTTTTTSTTIPSKKFMYAYSENFASVDASANKEYYIASVFNTIHMQQQGELNLYGPMMQSIFIYELLEKYNIKTHVFKHGQYKNAVNTITHTMYDTAHRTNVASLLYEINKDVCADIYTSRLNKIYNTDHDNKDQSSSTSSKKQGTDTRTNKKQNSTIDNDEEYGNKLSNDTIVSFWNRIYDIGTFTAEHATKIGLIDHTAHRNPLYDLILRNYKPVDTLTNDSTAGLKKLDDSTNGTNTPFRKLDETCNDIKMPGWTDNETDVKQFNADAILTVKQYQDLQKRKIESNKPKWYEKWIKELDEIKNPTKNNRIIILHLSGGIDDKSAFKFTHTLRKLRNNIIQNKVTDVKCIIVRVSSPGGSINACEMISQELQSLQKPMPNNIDGIPLIVSFGDVAASGGYYISAYADRIFANSKTITGSIGVFGVRIDLSQLTKQYGITVDQVMTGPLSSTNNSLMPMTDQQKNTVMNSINRAYAQFTSIVATGRTLPIAYVQDALGAGRVWTGNQGKTNGLVDEIGGIYRAIAYAKRTYCSKDIDDKDIIVECIQGSNNTLLYPNPDTSYSYNISNDNSIGDNDINFIFTIVYNYIVEFITGTKKYSNMVNYPIVPTQSLSSSLSGTYLTVDDNTALRLLLQQQPQQLHGSPLYTHMKTLNENPYITKSFWE